MADPLARMAPLGLNGCPFPNDCPLPNACPLSLNGCPLDLNGGRVVAGLFVDLAAIISPSAGSPCLSRSLLKANLKQSLRDSAFRQIPPARVFNVGVKPSPWLFTRSKHRRSEILEDNVLLCIQNFAVRVVIQRGICNHLSVWIRQPKGTQMLRRWHECDASISDLRPDPPLPIRSTSPVHAAPVNFGSLFNKRHCQNWLRRATGTLQHLIQSGQQHTIEYLHART